MDTNTKWMEGNGPNADIVISSRVRLARNLTGIPFPFVQSETAAKEVFNELKKAVTNKEMQKAVGLLKFITLGELMALDRQILVEKHLMSPQHAQPDGKYKALILRDDEAVSIMVNEEDHIRIQCLFSGLQLNAAWELAGLIDDTLEKSLQYAYSESKGYLTACPTNVGTGLRASAMMHLPALVITKQAGRVLQTLSKLGLMVRGLYGEGTEARGNLFQVSNQITLGPTEEEIISNLSVVTRQLLEHERSAREVLQIKRKEQLEDRVYRAYGTLTSARIISSDEALSFLSDLRLGIDLGIIRNVDSKVLNKLIVFISPAYIQKTAGQEMDGYGRDVVRAEIIRKTLGME